MSLLTIASETLVNIANAIRAKTGRTATMTPAQMVTEIGSIQGGESGIETVTAGANAITNTYDAVQYLLNLMVNRGNKVFYIKRINSASPTPATNEFAAIAAYYDGSKPSTANIPSNANAFRYRNGTLNITNYGTQYDCVITSGSKFEILATNFTMEDL